MPYAAIARTKRRSRTICLVLTPCSGCVVDIVSLLQLLFDREIIRRNPHDRRELHHSLATSLLTVVIGAALQGVREPKGAGEHDECARLVDRGKRNRHPQEQRGDAERDLECDGDQQCIAPRRVARRSIARGARPTRE